MQPQRPLLAIGLRLASAGCFATLLMLVKYVGESGVALPEIMFWRQALTLPLVVGWLWATSGLGRLRTRRLSAHARRALIGMTGMVFTFGAVILLPLELSTTLGFTTPLFAVLITGIVKREGVGPWRWTAVALGFIGVLIITQPSTGHSSVPLSTIGLACGLVAGLITAVINFLIRDLAQTEEPISITFWFALFGTPLAALALPFVMTSHTTWQWLVLIAIGVSGAIAQILLSTSLRFGSVATVIAIDYTVLIWTTFYGWAVWDHVPPMATWFGAPIIIAAGLVIAWREHRLLRRTAAPLDQAQ